MSEPATNRTVWLTGVLMLAANLIVGALMAGVLVQEQAIQAVLHEQGEALDVMLK